MEIVSFGINDPVPAEFVALPMLVHGDDPNWIPAPQEKVLAPFAASSAFHAAGEAQGFLALRKGMPAGRVAAFINGRLTVGGEGVGTLGSYEVCEDLEAPENLLGAALEWLRKKGIRRVWGPMNFTIFHGYRFMTRGFEQTPFFGEPYNHPSYPGHFERAEFKPMAKWHSWDFTQEQVQLLRTSLTSDVGPYDAPVHPAVQIVGSDPASFNRAMTGLHRLVTLTFREHLGYTAISLEEFQEVYGELGSILGRNQLVFAKIERVENVGFCLIYPDLAQILQAKQCRPRNKTQRPSTVINRVCLHSFGVVEEFRRMGILRCLLRMSLGNCLEYAHTIATMVREHQRNVFEKISPPTREYTLYERIL
jgi:hypothetical protein